jgi:hypothetical protein
MKKVFLIAVLFMLCFAFVAPVSAATCMPPQIPSSFYGYVNGGKVGQTVNAVVNGVVSASGTTIAYQGRVVYFFSVKAFDPCMPLAGGGRQGDKILFVINGFTVGTGTWRGGTNVQLDLNLTYGYGLSQ